MQQRARQRDPLLQSLRQLCSKAVAPVLQAESLEGVVHDRDGVGYLLQARVHEQVLADGKAIP